MSCPIPLTETRSQDAVLERSPQMLFDAFFGCFRLVGGGGIVHGMDPSGFSRFPGLAVSAGPQARFGLAHELGIAASRRARGPGSGGRKRPSRANRMVVREVGIAPVLPSGPVEAVRGNVAPELAAALAEGNAAQERGLAGEFEQAIEAIRGFSLADQEGGGDKGVTHGGVRRLVAGHVEIQPVAQGLVAVRQRVRPDVPGNA